MFGNAHFDRLRQLFADQFETEDTGLVYRKSLKSAPIRVTEAERDGFISAFNRRIRYAIWSLLPATILLIISLALIFPDPDDTTTEVAIFLGLAVILVPFLFAFYWVWNTPARALERRPQVGEERTREEIRRIMFAKLSYGRIAGVVAGALLLLWSASAKTDVLHGWGVLWLALAGLAIVTGAIQAFRKCRYERN